MEEEEGFRAEGEEEEEGEREQSSEDYNKRAAEIGDCVLSLSLKIPPRQFTRSFLLFGASAGIFVRPTYAGPSPPTLPPTLHMNSCAFNCKRLVDIIVWL